MSIRPPASVPPTPSAGFLGVVAVLLLTEQIASKAARDALFLLTFDPRELPPAMMGSALLSIVSVVVAAKAHARFRPDTVLRAVLVLSAALFTAESVLVWAHPHTAAVMLYLHVSALGALVVSSFWTIVSARWDPHAGKAHVARLASLAALGGVIGGILAQLSSFGGGPRVLLPVLAVASLATAGLVRASRPREAVVETEEAPAPPALGTIVRSGYLRGLAALAALVATWEALLDYVFKAAADATLTDEGALVRFFGVFYMATSVATFLVQVSIGKLALRRAGLAATAAATPLLVSLGIFTLLGSSFPVLVALRGGEALLSNSLLRSAYEVFFNPIPTAVLRATKTFVDVAATRLGDVLGSALVFLLVMLDVGAPSFVVVAAALGGTAIVLLPFITRGYVGSLTALLREGVRPEGDPELLDRTTRLAILGPGGVPSIAAADDPPPPRPHRAAPLADRVAALESPDVERARQALSAPLEPALVRIVLPLLAHRELRPLAATALRGAAERATGSLLDALLDPETPAAVRVRIPSLLRAAAPTRAVAGLLAGLDDDHLDVRLECARGLAHVAGHDGGAAIDRERVLRAIQREIDENASHWANDPRDTDDDDEASPLESLLQGDVARSLRCALILVSLTIDPRKLELALTGLGSPDPSVRGTAYELLLNVLPEPVREPLLSGLHPEHHFELPPRSSRISGEMPVAQRNG